MNHLSLRSPTRSRQRGISLLFALLALVGLSLAAIGLIRSVDTGVLVLGNVSLKKDATASANEATREALAALDALKAAGKLDSDVASEGYYATAGTNVDVTGLHPELAGRVRVKWDPDASCSGCITPKTVSTKVNNNDAQYVIFRLCQSTGDPDSASNSCVKPLVDTSGVPDHSATSYGGTTPEKVASSPYYRVVVRVAVGAKGSHETTSFTETIVHY